MTNITIGLVGLGKMGHAIAHRLIKHNYSVSAYDPNTHAQEEAQKLGVTCANSLQELAIKTHVIWLMVPAGDPVDKIINELLPNLNSDHIIIDGGNSNFHNSIRRYDMLAQKNIAFLDCGTSGGLAGKQHGFSLMIGGDKKAFSKVKNIFAAIAAPSGFEYMGPAGAGHYVKMIHNGIEYAILQSYAEGFDLLKNGRYKNLDLEKISKTWLNGSVIRSWILELAHNIFKHDQKLDTISGEIGENLTGQWTLEEAQEQKIPVDLIKRSLEIRAESRQTGGNYGTKVVAMLRNQFGGHEVKTKE